MDTLARVLCSYLFLSTGDARINKKIASCSSFSKMFLRIYELSPWIHTSCVCLQAVRLLKRGGVLVYSTCTVTLAENEELVAWALNTFPSLTLQPQVTNTSATWTDSQIQRVTSGNVIKSLLCFSSGASHRRRRHAGSRPVTWAAATPPEVQPRAELGPDGDGGSPLLQSRQGHHRLLYCQVPEKLTGGHVFSHSTVSPHTAETADWNNRVYITTLCVLWRGSVDKDARCAVYSICLLTAALWNCGPYRDKLYKHRGQGREGEGGGGRRGEKRGGHVGMETEWVLANAAVLASP